MFRTTVNVAGDMVAATVVHRFAGVPGGPIL
jgi:Na+/H+-dicarboxylate symporter